MFLGNEIAERWAEEHPKEQSAELNMDEADLDGAMLRVRQGIFREQVALEVRAQVGEFDNLD